MWFYHENQLEPVRAGAKLHIDLSPQCTSPLVRSASSACHCDSGARDKCQEAKSACKRAAITTSAVFFAKFTICAGARCHIYTRSVANVVWTVRHVRFFPTELYKFWPHRCYWRVDHERWWKHTRSAVVSPHVTAAWAEFLTSVSSWPNLQASPADLRRELHDRIKAREQSHIRQYLCGRTQSTCENTCDSTWRIPTETFYSFTSDWSWRDKLISWQQ